MLTFEKASLWVVYRTSVHGKPSGTSAVCEQAEWDAMEKDRPGCHTLVQAGIANEGEAERLARSDSGYGAAKPPSVKRPSVKRAAAAPAETVEPACPPPLS